MGQNNKENDIMPSKSKAQQRFFGVVKGIQKGTGKGTGKARKAADEMNPEDVTIITQIIII